MIQRLKIRDFKSIGELDLGLGPVTVLIGRSGAGKSNLMQAIRFLRNATLDLQAAVNHEGGWPRLLPAVAKASQLSIQVEFSMPAQTQRYTYRIEFGLLNAQMVLTSEFLGIGNRPLFSRRRVHPGRSAGAWPWEWDVEPQPSSPLGHQDGLMLGSFPGLQLVVDAFAALSTGIGYYHFPSTALDPQRVATVAPGGQHFPQMEGLYDDASNYLRMISAITRDFHNPEKRKSLLASVQKVDPSVVSIETDSLLNPQKAVVGHRFVDNGNIVDLSLPQESDGFRRFYAHLLALYQVPPKLTLVFEEPENAIFPGALSLLADEFKAAPRENRGQVILVTHSPILLDSFDVEDVRVVEMKEGSTVVGPVAKEKREAVKERLLTTGELLTVDTPKLDEVAPQPA